jgi:Ion channel
MPTTRPLRSGPPLTTLTTTGYGNLVPAANPGQTFAVLEMLTGQPLLVTAVAKVAGTGDPAWTRAPPTENHRS